MVHVYDHRRSKEEPGPVQPGATHQYLGARLNRRLKLSRYLGGAPLRAHGSDLGGTVERVTHPELLGQPYDPIHKRIVELTLNVDPFCRCAHLAGVEESGPHDGFGGEVRISVREHDRWVLASHFQMGSRPPGGACRCDLATDRRRTRERDEIYIGMSDQRPTDLAPTPDGV